MDTTIAFTNLPRGARHRWLAAAGVACVVFGATPARAQSFPLDRRIDVGPSARLAIETTRGRVDVTTGEGPMRVEGEVTVRIGWNAPGDAVARARQTAEAPPVDVRGTEVHLGLPVDSRARDAVIVHWRVRVPAGTRVQVRTVSGEVRVTGAAAPVEVSSGSGAVTVRGARGGVAVDGQSGAIELEQVSGDVRVRTGSGTVHVAMAAAGAVNVTTRSSAIDVQGAASGLRVSSGSGAVTVGGTPSSDWFLETRSSAITIRVARDGHGLDLRSRSGKVTTDRAGAAAGEHAVTAPSGTGATITARSGSGAIDLRASS